MVTGCVWGELASHKRLFNPPPQFSRLGTQGPALVLLCFVLCLLLCVVLIVEMEVGISFYSFFNFLLARMLLHGHLRGRDCILFALQCPNTTLLRICANIYHPVCFC